MGVLRFYFMGSSPDFAFTRTVAKMIIKIDQKGNDIDGGKC